MIGVSIIPQMTDEHISFLNGLSATTKMSGASHYLTVIFGLDRETSDKIVVYWKTMLGTHGKCESKFQIAVVDRGFVYVGHVSINAGWVTIENARCIRKWGTTKGLGELASGPTKETELDPLITLRFMLDKLIHLIDCDEAKWNK